MNQKLFDEFSPTTKKQWLQQATKDLRGKDFDETLVWQSPEGINIQPYYAQEDLENLPLASIQTAQSKNPKSLSSSGGWQNRPIIKFIDEKSTNLLIINTLQKGADAILLDLKQNDIRAINLVKLLDKIKLSETPIIFRVNNQSRELIEDLQKFINYQLKGGIQDDVLANFMQTGEIDNNWKNIADCINLTKNSPKFCTISIESHHFHNAGANAAQELAFTLASGITYLDKLTDEGLSIEEILPKIEFSISIGTNYFMEIAKIRALKYLWGKICEEFRNSVFDFAQAPQTQKSNRNGEPFQNHQSKIHSKTSTFYDAALSPYTNMLRATTEAMAAVIGGCDSLTVHRFDAVFKANEQGEEVASSDDFAERVARNISVLMKEEAHLDKTNDPSEGSYYIESLTNELANSAWELLLKVEEMGGIIPAFEAGFVQNEIEKSYQAKVASLQNGSPPDGKVMVGVNKFVFEENTLQVIDNERVTNNIILQNRRISQVFEK